MQQHTVNTHFNGGMQFTANVSNHDVLMDATAEDGGNDSGASPKRLMLAALAGCTGIDIVSILNKMKVSFTDFDIHIDANLTEEHPKTYNKVNILYSIKLAEADQPKMEKAVTLSQEKYCGVSAMFKKFATVNWQIKYL
ncbi:OsmC family protein [Ferruginibacter yonginensis]|uniref:OsmC family protein n=1 Tax=Ferruginibacter yonginensis TaxID=1310416 RepID=A0ABV8QTL8_9BACT